LQLAERLLPSVVDMVWEELQAHPEPEEPLLGAVVQIALEPAPLVVGRADDACARRL
jgi:hypothetical protein